MLLEYAAPVWNHLLTKTQIDQIEAIQRRTVRIIYSYIHDMSYISAILRCYSHPCTADRREQLSRKFLKSILEPSSCLCSLLPNPRDPSITARLRSANKFPRLPSRRKQYQTFISYALAQYQSRCLDAYAVWLSNCISIQTSILIFCLLFYPFSFLRWYFYLLHCDRCLVCICSIDLFGLMTTNLNKYYYYHSCIWRPRLGWPRSIFEKIFGIRKVESMRYRVTLFAWSYVWPFWYNTGLCQTDLCLCDTYTGRWHIPRRA